eukprot:scpid39164/ scgid34008/ 
MASELLRVSLLFLVLGTQSLMVLYNVLPKWEIVENRFGDFGKGTTEYGLWQMCLSGFNSGDDDFSEPFVGRKVCYNYFVTFPYKNIPSALCAAQAFSLLALVLVVMGAVMSMVVECETSSSRTLLKTPRIVFFAAAVCTALTCACFMSIPGGSLKSHVGHYHTSFRLAWADVAVGILLAIVAHFHHTSLLKDRPIKPDKKLLVIDNRNGV